MAGGYTPNYDLYLPEVGAEEDNWGDQLNNNFSLIDNILFNKAPKGVFESRADAINAFIADSVTVIFVAHDGYMLGYKENENGTALTTNDGTRNWEPLNNSLIEHFGGGVNQSGAVNTAAGIASLAWNNILRFGVGIYDVDGSIVGDGGLDAGDAKGVLITGEGQHVTIIRQLNHTVDTFRLEYSDGSQAFRFRAEVCKMHITYATDKTTSPDGSACIRVKESLRSHFHELVLEGYDHGIYLHRAGQCKLYNVWYRSSMRGSLGAGENFNDHGNHALSFVTCESNASTDGTCFEFAAIACKTHQNSNNGVENCFDIAGGELYNIFIGDYNGYKNLVKLRPVDVGGNLADMSEVIIDGIYGDAADSDYKEREIYLVPITTGTGAGTAWVNSIKLLNSKFRRADTVRRTTGPNRTVFNIDGFDFSGAEAISDVKILGNTIQGYGTKGAAIGTVHNKLRNVIVANNVIRDRSASEFHPFENDRAVYIGGKNQKSYGNVYTGNWTDTAEPPVQVDISADNWLVFGETFETARTIGNIVIHSTAAPLGESYGHTPPESGKRVVQADASITGMTILEGAEEGTFTPVLSFATPGDFAPANVVAVGRYIRIGDAVMLRGYIKFDSNAYTTAAGNIEISGLPFSFVDSRTGITITHFTRCVTPAGHVGVNANLPATGSMFNVRSMVSGAAPTIWSTAQIPASTANFTIAFTGVCYL